MSQFGRRKLALQTGMPLKLSADNNPERQSGVTLDWGTVAAVSGSDATYRDGTVVAVGFKGLEIGQILCQISQAEVSTVNLSGDDDPTGGTWPLTIAGDAGQGETYTVELEDIVYNVTAAALQAAIRLLDFPGAEKVLVSKSGFIYTITFPPESGNVTLTSNNGADFTGGGGDTFAISIGTSTQGVVNEGKWGPHDPNATDGRQLLLPQYTCALNQSLTELGGVPGLSVVASDYPDAIVGGRVIAARLKVTPAGSGQASLANGPELDNLIAALPRMILVF